MQQQIQPGMMPSGSTQFQVKQGGLQNNQQKIKLNS